MNDKLSAFIDAVYRQPYSLVSNNCIHKSLQIKAKAAELGMRVDLIGCIAITPVKKWHNFPIVFVHVYTEIEGERVDVALDPGREEICCKNSEIKVVMPVNVSKIRRVFCRGAGLRSHLLKEG
ncbi:MAG: hypothetical protein E3J75_05205 [Dehalococcoidia bacterium]|nr:MAG: hypothetical protein E3J75_05205 [Dehalococcoidia bacterium]